MWDKIVGTKKHKHAQNFRKMLDFFATSSGIGIAGYYKA